MTLWEIITTAWTPSTPSYKEISVPMENVPQSVKLSRCSSDICVSSPIKLELGCVRFDVEIPRGCSYSTSSSSGIAGISELNETEKSSKRYGDALVTRACIKPLRTWSKGLYTLERLLLSSTWPQDSTAVTVS